MLVLLVIFVGPFLWIVVLFVVELLVWFVLAVAGLAAWLLLGRPWQVVITDHDDNPSRQFPCEGASELVSTLRSSSSDCQMAPARQQPQP